MRHVSLPIVCPQKVKETEDSVDAGSRKQFPERRKGSPCRLKSFRTMLASKLPADSKEFFRTQLPSVKTDELTNPPDHRRYQNSCTSDIRSRVSNTAGRIPCAVQEIRT